jgi:DNA-binding NarL/FixJ family response regulator
MTDAPRKRILLVDDHALFRSSLTMLLEHSLNYNVVKACDSLSSVKEDVEKYLPDIVLMDYHMPKNIGIRCGCRIRRIKL